MQGIATSTTITYYSLHNACRMERLFQLAIGFIGEIPANHFLLFGKPEWPGIGR